MKGTREKQVKKALNQVLKQKYRALSPEARRFLRLYLKADEETRDFAYNLLIERRKQIQA
ncbi:MAG: hypothetical protein ACFWT7_01105 [Succiniclasticum sp.]